MSKNITINDFSDQTLFEVAAFAYMQYHVIEPKDAPNDLVKLIKESCRLDMISCRDIDAMGSYIFYGLDIDAMMDSTESTQHINLYNMLLHQMIRANKRAWNKWHALCN